MRVLNTRPEAEATALDRRLGELGHTSVRCPLLNIRPRRDAAVDLDGVQAIAVTSAAAIRALGRLDRDRTLPIYAVGDATAQAARDMGFDPVQVGGGDVAALVDLMAGTLDPAAGAVLHPRGATVAGDLAGALNTAGFKVRAPVLYDARPARELPRSGWTALESGALDAVLFFSPRTAATFVSVLTEADLTESCQSLDALCLSPAVAEAAEALAWRRIRWAAKPDQESLLTLLAD